MKNLKLVCMQLQQPFDFLIPIHVSISNPEPAFENYQGEESKNHPIQPDTPGKIIELSWCAYNLSDQTVVDERHYYIRPLNSIRLSEETVNKLRIDINHINSEGISLADAINLLNDYLYMNFIKQNLSFCFVCLDDELLTRALPADAFESNVRLQHCFFHYFNVEHDHQKFFPAIDDRKFYINTNLQGLTYCQTQCRYITYLASQLVDIGYYFTNPILIHFEAQPIKTISSTKAGDLKEYDAPLQPEMESTENLRDDEGLHYIRMRGLPYHVREPEIIDFLRGVRVNKEDVALCYDYIGKFTGEAYVRLHHVHDLKKACALHKSELGKRFIDIYKANEADYLVALQSKNDTKKTSPLVIKKPTELLDETCGVLKLRGLPFSCTDQDIKEFFSGFNIRKDGIKRTMQGGRPSGEAFVVFEDRSQIDKALGLNKQKIGSRYIEIFLSSSKELERYESQNARGNGSTRVRDRLPDVPSGKRSSTLLVVGLPFSIKKSEIQEFFYQYNIDESDIQFVANSTGRFSGRAVVTFENEAMAQKAKEKMNRKYIGERYVELSEY